MASTATGILRRYSILISLFLFTFLVSSTQRALNEDRYDSEKKEIAALPDMSEQKTPDQRPDATPSRSERRPEDDEPSHDSDDEPMVYVTPRDYASWARETRARRIAEGADPDSVILMSQIRDYIPRVDGDGPADFAERYMKTFNDLIGRGVQILNDQCTGDMAADGFHTEDGRFFDLGPGSGVTKGEYREFNRWFNERSETQEVPEKWLRFEKPAPEASGAESEDRS